jgi:hypothetical protein
LHKQHHFIISRIGAQPIWYKIKQSPFIRPTYDELLCDLFNKTDTENIVRHYLGDKETHYSSKTPEEEKWNNTIATAMQEINSNIIMKNK